MAIVRLSGRVQGKKDPNRRKRAELLYILFDAGWDIYNGNGDQVVTLENIQKKIIESDAYVFMPGANLEDYFHAASIFVGYQTKDNALQNKPAIVLNSDNTWNPFLNLIEHLREMGTISQKYNAYLEIIKKPKKVAEVLEQNIPSKKTVLMEPDIFENHKGNGIVHNGSRRPVYKVCVFCSASIRKEAYLKEGYELGKNIALEGWGCVTGAGCTGIMGQVTKGATENDGWTGGSNVPHIIALEGLPDGLDEFWPRADIYTRMEVMIKESDAFVIMPGGMGTIQELFALLLLKQQNNDLMKDKEIVIFNRRDEKGKYFWAPVLDIIKRQMPDSDFKMVTDFNQIIVELKNFASNKGN